MADQAQIDSFVKTYEPYYTQAAHDLGINPAIVAGQWALESGWGTDQQAVDAKNLGGVMKGPGVMWAFGTWDQFVQVYVNSMKNDCPALQDGTTNHESLTAEEVLKDTRYNVVNAQYGAEVQRCADMVDAILHPAASPETAAPVSEAPAAFTATDAVNEIRAVLAKLN